MADTKPLTAGEERQLTPWDGNLEPDLAADMRDRATRIRKMQQDAILEVGRQLLSAKELVAYGCFVAWVQSGCQLHIRTAQRAMLAAEMVEKNDNLSYLPPDGLLALAAPSAPEGVKAKIVEEINAGAKPTAAEIKRQIQSVKDAQKHAAAQQSGAADNNGQDDQDAQEDAASQAVDLLYEYLGDRFGEFLTLFDKAGDRFGAAVRQRRATSAAASPLHEPPADGDREPEAATQPAPLAAAMPQLSDRAELCLGNAGAPSPSKSAALPADSESRGEVVSEPPNELAAKNTTETARGDEASAQAAATEVEETTQGDDEFSAPATATLPTSDVSQLTGPIAGTKAREEVLPSNFDPLQLSPTKQPLAPASPAAPRYGEPWAGCPRKGSTCGYRDCHRQGRCLAAATAPGVAAQAA